jgi:hypothetical protein
LLDSTEILVAMNLDSEPRNDFVTVDADLCAAGQKLVNLLAPEQQVTVEQRGQRCAVRVPLDGHEMVILKRPESF